MGPFGISLAVTPKPVGKRIYPKPITYFCVAQCFLSISWHDYHQECRQTEQPAYQEKINNGRAQNCKEETMRCANRPMIMVAHPLFGNCQLM
jgi:hypothetical protein